MFQWPGWSLEGVMEGSGAKWTPFVWKYTLAIFQNNNKDDYYQHCKTPAHDFLVHCESKCTEAWFEWRGHVFMTRSLPVLLKRNQIKVGVKSIILKMSCSINAIRQEVNFLGGFTQEKGKYEKFEINPLSAKPSFHLWYPGGQRLKMISFSWSWVKSPSKCFSNTKPTTIIASRDEKRCHAPVQWARSVQSGSLRVSDQHRKCHGWLLFFAFPALQPDRPAAVHPRPRKQRSAKTVATSGLGNRLLKTRWFVDDEGLSLRKVTRWLPCVLFFFWTMNHRTRLVPIATMIDGPSALDLANARKSSFILVFNVPSPKSFAQPGDRHSCQPASNTGSALEKRMKILKKYSWS